MTIYALTNEVVTLFVALGVNLIIHFSDPVTAAGGDDNIAITPLNNNKSFIINATNKNIFETNIVFFNESSSFNVRLAQNNKHVHDFINLRKGVEDTAFTLRYENEHFRVLEGQRSTLVENKGNDSIIVNNDIVTASVFKSKGAPLFITAKGETFLLNHGREL